MDQYTLKYQKIEDAIDTFFQNIEKTSFVNIPKAIKTKHIDELKTPCTSLVSQGGKRWRPLLLVLCTELFAQDSKNEKKHEDAINKAYAISPLVELIHTASLIHDDIEDASETRRGKPAIHIQYGLDKALNAGSWLYFAALTAIEKTFSKKIEEKELQYRLLQYSLEGIRHLHLGQAMDISWHQNKDFIPSIAEYEAMISLKTGSLAALSAVIGASIGGASETKALALGKLIMEVGIAFQIIDDYTNLVRGNPGKKRGDDIVEGKKSYPILLHLEKNPQDKDKIVKYFQKAKNEGIDSSAVEDCIECIKTSDALDEAKAKAKKRIIDSCETLVYLYNNEAAQNITKLFYAMFPSTEQ